MKKLVLTMALATMASGMYAQKSNVNRAYNLMMSEPPKLDEAWNYINPALTNEESKDWTKTWYTAAKVQYKKFDTEYTKKAKGQGENAEVMYGSLNACYDYLLKATETNKIPNEKGKLKPLYVKEITSDLKLLRNFFIDAGNYYAFDKKDIKKGVENFERFLTYDKIDVLSGENFKKDTMYYSVALSAGYAAFQGQDYAKSAELLEPVLDKIDEANDLSAYRILMADYDQLKAADKMEALLKRATDKYPKEIEFVAQSINVYLGKEDVKGALEMVNKAIALDDKKAEYWEIKGQLEETINPEAWEEPLAAYQKAIDLNPSLVSAYNNCGRIYFNMAAKEQQKAQELKDVKAYNEQMAKANPFFEKAAPFFEKVRDFNPEDKGNLERLRTIYFNLNQGAKYEELNKILEKE